ncbi:differentially expressed in FDCP 6 homolog [Ranitomeya variabilis]|uniref:differentially expressed in FDCP 6 homolog n=1 Tax=Ranitomeya variabilis TaxID=490064 RepID=UPI00405611E7
MSLRTELLKAVWYAFTSLDTEKSGKVSKSQLKPLVKALDSHVRDSSHLIEICASLVVPDNAILVTLDVEALYTNIEHKQVDFLDLKVSIDRNRIATTLFQKRTATNNLLHFESFHPAHLRRGIPNGQFLRLRRNCTHTEDFRTESRQLTNRFR